MGKRPDLAERNRTHGLSHLKEYRTWVAMRERCYYTKNKHYKDYGARGIVVCDRWRNSFEKFHADMGLKPTPKHSIDRINNNGNYEPSNCRWATAKEQAANTRQRKNNTSGITGVAKLKNGAFIVKFKQKYCGYFFDFFEACCRRKSLEAQTPNKKTEEN